MTPRACEEVVENVTETKLGEPGATILELTNLVLSAKTQFKSREDGEPRDESRKEDHRP
jgi:hypothetical protein